MMRPLAALVVLLLALLSSCSLTGCHATPDKAAIDPDAPPRDLAALRQPDEVRVMSFNLRTSTIFDLHNTWGLRKDLLVRTIDNFGPDLLGTQECRPQQARFLRGALEGYGFVGAGRQDGDDSGEMVALFYRKAAFEKLEEGHFWLSTTPTEPGSESWDTLFPRMVTWAKLRRQSDAQTVFWFNTHFSAFGDEARHESARLLRKRIVRLAGASPVVVTGDFNARIDSRPYQALVGEGSRDDLLLADVYGQLNPDTEQGPGTIHGFDGRSDGRRIDWILTTPGFESVAASIDRSHAGGSYPSDHFPVTAVLRWPSATAQAEAEEPGQG
jgi:endonuclease/exonuclease/phosphatase family metal-dependent hydrolase